MLSTSKVVKECCRGNTGKFSTTDGTSASLPSLSDSWNYEEEVQDPLIVGSSSWKRQIFGNNLNYRIELTNCSVAMYKSDTNSL